jgi:ribosome-associated toxin RatA of RatAB toxin-antitoxin module
MSDRTEASLQIAAPPQQVLDVIADVASYPQWANGITEAEVLESGSDGRPARARFRLDAGPVRDEYVIAYTWAADTVSWTLVTADVLSAMDGSYVLTPTDDGSRVEYRLKVDLKMPMLGLLKRKAERAVVDTALKDLRRRVEG